MLDVKSLCGRINSLEGKSAPGGLSLPDYMSLLARRILEQDHSIPLTKEALQQAFESFKDRWFAQLPSTLDEIQAGYQWPGYMSVLFECFYNWTFRSTALSLQFFRRFDIEPEEILVFADGFGAASCMYADQYPRCKVIAHIMGEKQLAIANHLKRDLRLTNMEITTEARPAEVVIAFEAFEHFTDPIAIAAPLLEKANILIYTAPWNVSAHGHFLHYSGVTRAQFGRAFGKFTRGMGFVDSGKALSFSFFNGYPRILIKQP